MHDISLIYSLLTDNFYQVSESSQESSYHICDTPQPLPDISSGVLRLLPKSLTERSHDRHFKSEFLDRAIAFLQDLGFHEPKRSLNFTVATRRQRQRSHSFTLRSCRSAWQEKQKYAAKTEKVRTAQNCEALTGKGLRAFLPVRTAISWRVLAYRFNLKKSAQTEREAGRSTGYEGRVFLRRIEPLPDSAIVVQSAIFLQEGGAS